MWFTIQCELLFEDENTSSLYAILKIFYQNISENYFNESRANKDFQNTLAEGSLIHLKVYMNIFIRKFFGFYIFLENFKNTEANQGIDAYILLGDYKCYALNRSNYQFYAIYEENIPVYAIRYFFIFYVKFCCVLSTSTIKIISDKLVFKALNLLFLIIEV